MPLNGYPSHAYGTSIYETPSDGGETYHNDPAAVQSVYSKIIPMPTMQLVDYKIRSNPYGSMLNLNENASGHDIRLQELWMEFTRASELVKDWRKAFRKLNPDEQKNSVVTRLMSSSIKHFKPFSRFNEYSVMPVSSRRPYQKPLVDCARIFWMYAAFKSYYQHQDIAKLESILCSVPVTFQYGAEGENVSVQSGFLNGTIMIAHPDQRWPQEYEALIRHLDVWCTSSEIVPLDDEEVSAWKVLREAFETLWDGQS